MKSIKEKLPFSDKNDQYKLLTCVPDSWSIYKIMEFFEVTEHMARYSRKLRNAGGPFTAPPKKAGRPLSEETQKAVIEFYLLDEISRILPGKKDFVSVKVGNKREHLQKRLLLSTCTEAYREFKQRFPEHKVGISRFTQLKPKVSF